VREASPDALQVGAGPISVGPGYDPLGPVGLGSAESLRVSIWRGPVRLWQAPGLPPAGPYRPEMQGLRSPSGV